MTITIYKVNTNFFETPLDIGFQSDKLYLGLFKLITC